MSRPTQYPVESHLTPLKGHTFSRTAEWWRAIVRSATQDGDELLRLYLWRNNDQKGWIPKHKWNIHPDRWDNEKSVVKRHVRGPINEDSTYFPVQHYHVIGGETITKTDSWWTAVVHYEDDWSSTPNTRLYMWQFENDEPKGTGFKWNINTDTWGEERRAADGMLANTN